ncbi:DNA-binding proteins Bright/BRCAA1/rbp1 [Branchiostoma belcheri]|nr:DNA-binding proteins Bright/BRCAA1/rbp1 [Branchiostoma belcheri]
MAFTGNWKHVKSENFEDYLKALGVGFAMRKIAGNTSPRIEIQQDGDNFKIKTIGPKTREVSFKVGENFEDEMPMGKVKVTPTWDGDKLHFDVDSPKGKLVTEREIRDDGRMYMVMKAMDGTTCTRIFAKDSLGPPVDLPPKKTMSFSGTFKPHKVDKEGMKKFYELLDAPPAILEGVGGFLDKIYYSTEDNGDSLTTTIHGLPDGDKVKTMKLGEEVDDTGRLGKLKLKMVRDGNKMRSTETYANGKTSSIVRELNGDEMTVTMTTGDFTVSHVYKKE